MILTGQYLSLLNLQCFRPLMGIILFNIPESKTDVLSKNKSFRPLMGIILFNGTVSFIDNLCFIYNVSVP